MTKFEKERIRIDLLETVAQAIESFERWNGPYEYDSENMEHVEKIEPTEKEQLVSEVCKYYNEKLLKEWLK